MRSRDIWGVVSPLHFLAGRYLEGRDVLCRLDFTLDEISPPRIKNNVDYPPQCRNSLGRLLCSLRPYFVYRRAVISDSDDAQKMPQPKGGSPETAACAFNLLITLYLNWVLYTNLKQYSPHIKIFATRKVNLGSTWPNLPPKIKQKIQPWHLTIGETAK